MCGPSLIGSDGFIGCEFVHFSKTHFSTRFACTLLHGTCQVIRPTSGTVINDGNPPAFLFSSIEVVNHRFEGSLTNGTFVTASLLSCTRKSRTATRNLTGTTAEFPKVLNQNRPPCEKSIGDHWPASH